MGMLKQSTERVRTFIMVDVADHLSPKTGITPTVNISKAGGSFAAAGGVVAEIANGWYKITLTTTDTNTLGDLAFHITGTGADPTQFRDEVVAVNFEDSVRLGLTALPNANAAASGGLATVDASNAVKVQSGTGANQINLSAGNVVLQATTHAGAVIPTVTDVTNDVGITQTGADKVWASAARTLTSFGSLVANIWDYALTSISAAGSIGKLIEDNLDTTVSSRSTYSGGAVASVTNPVTVGTNSDKSGYSLSSAGIDAILDDAPASELTAVPTTTGTLRQMIQFIFSYFRNRRSITSTTETLYREDTTTSLGTATVSDDGTTVNKGEMN